MLVKLLLGESQSWHPAWITPSSAERFSFTPAAIKLSTEFMQYFSLKIFLYLSIEEFQSLFSLQTEDYIGAMWDFKGPGI